MKKAWIYLLPVIAAFLALPSALLRAETASEIDTVLTLGPLPFASQALDDSPKADEIRRALIMQLSDSDLPAPGASIRAFGQSLTWQAHPPEATAKDSGPSVWMVHLQAQRFVRGRLLVSGLAEPKLWLNGEPYSPEENGVELDLSAGTHTLWLFHHGADQEQTPGLQWKGNTEVDHVDFHVEPWRLVSARLLTNAETATELALSPDGEHLAITFSARNDAADLDLARVEVRALDNNRIVRQWTSNPPRSLQWSPDADRLAVQEGDNLWLHDLASGQARLLLANHERIGSWRWHPDGGSILFAWTEAFEADNDQRRRLRSLEDRWASFRDNTQLYQVDIESGLVRPLTAGASSVNLLDVHPDGDRLLLTERIIDYAEPPHSLFRLYTMELPSLETSDVGQYRQINAALFAEEGYWLLAGPGLVQGDGATTEEALVPNEYDTQLYALSADGETARSLSRGFDPSFGNMHRLVTGDLLLSATWGEEVALVHVDPVEEDFRRIDTGLEVMEQFVASDEQAPVVVVRGTDADAPQRIHRIDLAANGNEPEVLLDTRPSEYDGVRLSEVRPWSFTNESGDAIEGRYYLPPGFDPDQSYPLIVYYYGGTTPVNRQFTGRYPFQLWAAKGYVVYVLQPRGTIGYGQDFSALHVNAWGRYTAEDIIEGTQRFVAAHPFIDGERIGNIGASYGGFMTMHLATLTDLYAASVSHAGISALTSYWGQGWWGYGYSGIASRGSFPWNNPELYVGQSPVYSADRITTPLLLLTGDADTNVPPGESHNMYTALRLLGRDVELVEFPGEDHWILDREKRYVWWDTMLAWFDKWLKDEPEWWQHLYPETAPEG
ncbi:alpha/beta hydrolase family protein [Wenzhouxiangella limi]|uniref:Prolyl oligopeptidase family serine peptidase n=1 Tax=Wenzhouxiangella limi TaxID=2707351 RepID=A0A845V742_9GAMM|nr:S9 family peptidase [Wenzhouxiangella limi]NDY95775.1 prolyl oligopeptidase family serine peptidase [Wenzhouxiangella limi]